MIRDIELERNGERHFMKYLSITFLIYIMTSTSSLSAEDWKELTPSECPVTLTEINNKEGYCLKKQDRTNRRYEYAMMWEQNSKNIASEIYYRPLEEMAYWKKTIVPKVSRIKNWQYLSKINTDKVTTLNCFGYNCVTFKAPDDLPNGTCFWFAKILKQSRVDDWKKGKGDQIEGYVCSTSKNQLYTKAEVEAFIKKIEY